MGSYDKDSWQVKQGEGGNDRALDLITRRLSDRGSKIVVKRGPKNPGANGKLGDILFSRPDEAPLIGIEVKTPKARYPDSISITCFEVENSRAMFLMGMNEDPDLGCWFQLMSTIRARLKYRDVTNPRKGERPCAKHGVHHYYTSEPPIEDRVPLDTVLDEIQRLFGER